MRTEEAFDEYYEKFKYLPQEEKIKMIIEEYKQILSFLTKLNGQLNLDNRMLINKDMMNIELSKTNVDDFINSSFIYINSIKESFGIYVGFLSDLIYKENNKED